MKTTRFFALSLVLFAASGVRLHSAETAAPDWPKAFRQHCFGCHGKSATGGISLQKLLQAPVGENFQQWEKVVAALEEKRMPPKPMPGPSDADRNQAVDWVRSKLDQYVQKHADDPGKVTVRRLTTGEYAYTIRDLTGLDLKFDMDSGTDAVGGEGFTNFGDVQFMQDANLQRYLEAAKKVADHAVIGSGPIQFFADPGKSGFELSAIHRIQDIYWTHGFRAAAGEGGKPYGLERYGKAFHAAWRYKHRKALGKPDATLAGLAAEHGITERFLEHIWSVVNRTAPVYPVSEVVAKFQALPAPGTADAELKAKCDEIQQFLIAWPRWLFAAGSLAAGGAGDERALVISEATLPAKATHKIRFGVRGGRGQKTAMLRLTSVPVNPLASDKAFVVWRNPSVRIRIVRRTEGQVDVARARPTNDTPSQPLRSLLDEATAVKLGFGKLPDGTAIEPNDLAMPGDAALAIEIPLPEGAAGVGFESEATMAGVVAGDAVLRLTVSGREETRGRPTWALLANPESPGFKKWRTDVLDFAANLPQVSHGEPTPSDNDPIPAPFNNTYNQPERNYYHARVKYYRQDDFIRDKMLDDAARTRLEQAWTDLLTSFEYHDAILHFYDEKFGLNLNGKSIADFTDAEIEALPEEPRRYIRPLRAEYVKLTKARAAGESRHVDDCIEFASRAWRRPLSASEQESLRSFYRKIKGLPEYDHAKAVRALIARVLVAPAFLYKFETPTETSGVRLLTDWEVANRLSYFLWSSVPDAELRRAAAAGELKSPEQLRRQAKRMLADPKAKRFATEFFGQWLGFYRFDEYRGVDTTRFPEFTADVKAAMYEEAVAFFDHVVRKDRPVKEIFTADYTFLDEKLAKHYGVKADLKGVTDPKLVENVDEFHRGGLLRLGAVLTATSAPLRTSPVKRGDWVLRRILGTPTPPPPPDAGSLPSDPRSFGGLTLFEKLEAHIRNPSCARCHVRIDPMGFPLEGFDAVGRWREKYDDGNVVYDSSVTVDDAKLTGVDGLLNYLLSTQQDQVMENLSHKMIGYALGRTVSASDKPLVKRLTAAGMDASFADLAAEIVASRQFRYRRERQETGSEPRSPAVQQSAQVNIAIRDRNEENAQ